VWGYTKHGDTHITVPPATDYPRAFVSFPRIAGSGNEIGGTACSQPRTQAQITKTRHTTVLLYRSGAKLSERAGVLGEDAGNEAPGRICNKHGGHEEANEEIAVLFAHRALHLGKILCPNDHCVVIRTFPRKRYYLSF
jgi:hypothetical protein